MHILLQLYLNQVMIFVLILTRVSGLFMLAPIMGSQSVPRLIRALLAVGVAALLTPMHWGLEIDTPRNLLQLVVLLGREAALGAALATSVMILFAGLQVAGYVIGQMGGMALADVADPTFDESMSVFAQLLNLIALAVFVLIGGLGQVTSALLDMFRWLPPGRATIPASLTEALLEITQISFVTALRAAAPVMVALMLAMLVMGLISRTLPQLNILAVGFSINALVVMVTLLLALGSTVWVFQDQTSATLDLIRNVFLTDGQGG